MAEPPSEMPAGAPVVGSWLEDLFEARPPRTLWSVLDEPLRLTLAQGWIWSRGYVDDDGAHALAEADSEHEDFETMVGELVSMWRYTYDDLRSGFGVMAGTEVTGVDLELVLIVSGQHIGPYEAGTTIDVRPFITRYTGRDWVIAANKRMLPIPGWPPTWAELPQ